MITTINKLADFKASRASIKTLLAAGGDDDRYKLTGFKMHGGIEFEITDEQAPTSASTDVVFSSASYATAMQKLRALDDEDCTDVDPENVYGSTTIAQSIAEDKK